MNTINKIKDWLNRNDELFWAIFKSVAFICLGLFAIYLQDSYKKQIVKDALKEYELKTKTYGK